MISHEELKQLNIDGYHPKGTLGYLETYTRKYSGINAHLFNRKGNYILCFAGTISPQDVANDIQMVQNQVPEQAKQAQALVASYLKRFPNLIITGHSLGGSIAQLLGAIFGNETVCFSPFGTALFNHGKFNKITNYGMEDDGVYICNLENQVGTSYLLPSPKSNTNIIQNQQINYNTLVNLRFNKKYKPCNHFLESYTPLSRGCKVDEKLFTDALIKKYARPPMR